MYWARYQCLRCLVRAVFKTHFHNLSLGCSRPASLRSSGLPRQQTSKQLHALKYIRITEICRQVSVEGSQLLHALLVACTNDAALSQQLVGIALHDKERLRAASFRAMSSFVNIHSHDVSHDCKGIMKR